MAAPSPHSRVPDYRFGSGSDAAHNMHQRDPCDRVATRRLGASPVPGARGRTEAAGSAAGLRRHPGGRRRLPELILLIQQGFSRDSAGESLQTVISQHQPTLEAPDNGTSSGYQQYPITQEKLELYYDV